jgi:ubiquinone/menaquinone biosynthesis C-methylase UbiE
MLSDKLKTFYDPQYSIDGVASIRHLVSGDVMMHIRQVLGPLKVRRLLDVGAGEGSMLHRLAECQAADEFYAVEISTSAVEALRSRNIPNLKQVDLFDGYAIPHQNKKFDIVTCIHVLEHIEHERLFLQELRRVSKRIIVEVPLANTLRVRSALDTRDETGHINIYNIHTFRNVLETSGLRVSSLRVFSMSGAYERCLYGQMRGTIKNAFRRAFLTCIPGVAQQLFTYMAMALVECD